MLIGAGTANAATPTTHAAPSTARQTTTVLAADGPVSGPVSGVGGVVGDVFSTVASLLSLLGL